MPTLISAVIPAYKRPELLKQAVESVIAQTHRPLELVIVNDGSPDDTAAQMEAMRPAVEAAGIAASFHSKENGGVASARNYGMQRASGEYVALLDADDLFFPTKLEKQLAAVSAENADASSCLVERRIGERVSLYPSDAAGLLSGRNPGGVLRLEVWTHTNSLFLSRELLDRAGLYDERLEIFEDDAFLIRLAHHGKFAAVPEALATWIDQPESLSQVPDYATLMMRDRNRRKQLDITREVCSDQPGWDESAWKRSVDRWYKQIINHYIWANDLKGATENLEAGVARAGWLPLLKRSRKKLRKAKLLRLIGLRIKNPKNDPIYDQA
ncbi:MAG: glycosyltransferase family A protein [Planctomycetota bacterium]